MPAIPSFCRQTGLLLLTLWVAASAAAAPPELDGLAKEIAAFTASPAPAGPTSRELLGRLSLFEQQARSEPAGAARQAELDRLEALHRELGRAGFAAVRSAGNSEGLAADGTIAGVVTYQGAPIEGTRVRAFTTGGLYLTDTFSGADGRYSLTLPPGTYLIHADPPVERDLAPQLYLGVVCRFYFNCPFQNGTPQVLPSGGNLVVNFQLAKLGGIEGQLRARESAAPLAEGEVFIYDSAGIFEGNTFVGADGRYAIGGLLPGDYYVVAASYGDRVGMIYRDVACYQPRYTLTLFCPRELGAKVRVAVDQVTSGIDFDLYRGATIEGRILDAASGLPPTGSGLVVARRPDYVIVAQGQLQFQDGTYKVEGLLGGRYYLQAEGGGYTSQFYRGNDCIDGPHCLAGALAIDVETGGTYSGIDFQLNRLGTLSGRIFDETGSGLDGARVSVQDRRSTTIFRETTTDITGFYSFSELPAVEVAIKAEHSSYVPEYYDNVDARLGVAAATPVKVPAGSLISGIDLRLAKRGSLVGRVVAAESGAAVSCTYFLIPVDANPDEQPQDSCQEGGRFEATNLLPGRYYLQARDYNRADYLYGKGSCNHSLTSFLCDLSQGTPIEVRAGETTGPIVIPLELSASLGLSFDFVSSGNSPEPDGRFRLFEEGGQEVLQYRVEYPQSPFLRNLAPGTYRAVFEGGPDWQSFAFDGVACGRWYCDPWRGAAIPLAAGESRGGIHFRLEPLPPYAGCTPSDTALCLNQGRYEVKATWRDFGGASGAGRAQALTADTGYFYFFSPDNLEVMVKALNGCEARLGHHFWVYGAGLTNVQVELRVRDTLTGEIKLYSNALGQTFQPILDSGAFATCDAVEPAGLAAEEAKLAAAAAEPGLGAPLEAASGATTAYCDGVLSPALCLAGRFRVLLDYRTIYGYFSSAFPVPITSDTGAFYFFDSNNLEVVVKMLDACSSQLPGFWVFASGLTDIEVQIQIEDLATGRKKTYQRGPGPFSPILDLGSFPSS